MYGLIGKIVTTPGNRDAFAATPERFLHDVGKRWPALLEQLGQ